MTWILIAVGLWILGKILESMESGSAQTYTLAGRSQKIRSEAMSYIDAYLAAIDAICAGNRVGYALGFIQTCVALQMAKADGIITVDELKTIKTSILGAYAELLGEKDLKKAYDLNKEHLGKLSKSEISALAGALVVHLGNIVMENFSDDEARKQLVVHILTLPYEVALADGQVTHDEQRLFDAICNAAGIDEETEIFIVCMAEFNAQQRTNYEKDIDSKVRKIQDALQLFALRRGFSEQDMKDAWRTYAKLNHPDRFHDVDPIVHSQIKEQFQKGSAARDLIQDNLVEIHASPEKYFGAPKASSAQESYSHSSARPEAPQTNQARTEPKPSSAPAPAPEPEPLKQNAAWADIAAKFKAFFVTRFSAIRRLDGKYILTFIRNHRLKFAGGMALLLVIVVGIIAYPEIRFHRNFAKLVTGESALHEEGVTFFQNTSEYDDRLKNSLKKEEAPLHILSIVELLLSKQLLIEAETWTIVRERFEAYVKLSDKDTLPASLRMLAALPSISVDTAVWLFDKITAGHMTTEDGATTILKGKKIIGTSLTPLFAKINLCLQNCRISSQTVAAMILQSKVSELTPVDLKAAISALQKALISKQLYLESISALFASASSIDAYSNIDSAFASKLASMDNHAIDACAAQISLAISNPLFAKKFLKVHKAHLSQAHSETLAVLASPSENVPNPTDPGSGIRRGMIKSSECVQLRSDTSIYSKSYGCFPSGTHLEIIEVSGIEETHHGETANWVKVKFGTHMGWMFGAFVKET